MKRSFVFLFGTALMAQTPMTVARLYDNQVRGVERQLVSLAEAMPAEKYGFAPKDGAFDTVRTFAQQAKHTAAVLYMVSAAMLGEKPPVDVAGESGPDSIASKEQIVKYLKEAFTYAHKAIGTLTAENQVQMVPSPFGSGQMARGGLAAEAAWHSFDHYGQMVVYARMNRIVPPASLPTPPPAKQ